jgi:vacuolar-type H+-ATPase subunit I/STV1
MKIFTKTFEARKALIEELEEKEEQKQKELATIQSEITYLKKKQGEEK